jgi:F-type H+-transporting ATPase subunit epsilon
MAKTIELKIVTPQRTVYQGTVDDFTAPGVLGPFQVLFNHAAIVSKLQPGLLRFKETSGAEEHYYVSGGFLELHDNAGTVLADTAEHSTDINVAEAEASIERLRQRYADHEEGFTNEQFHIELDAAQARLKVAKS